MKQQTFVMIKQLGLLHLMPEILESLRTLGHEVCGCLVKVSRELIEEHYVEHRNKDFFPTLIDAYTRKTVMALVWEGDDIIAKVRERIGPADPHSARPDQIRFRIRQLFPNGENGWAKLEQLTRHVDNLIHASDSEAAAKREIALWEPYMQTCSSRPAHVIQPSS